MDCLQAKVGPVVAYAFKHSSDGAHVLLENESDRGGDSADIFAARSCYVTMIALDALQSEAST